MKVNSVTRKHLYCPGGLELKLPLNAADIMTNSSGRSCALGQWQHIQTDWLFCTMPCARRMGGVKSIQEGVVIIHCLPK